MQHGIELVDCPGVEAADSQKYHCTWQALKVPEPRLAKALPRKLRHA